MPFAQIVLGPPGSGKTTYCNGMQQFLQANHRDVAVVNMDPANEQLPYVADVDVSEMVCLENVMEELGLGPNGGACPNTSNYLNSMVVMWQLVLDTGLVYCMDYIDVNFDWLEEKLAALKDKYVLFDFPGQVELYTHENSVHNILHKLQKLGYRLAVVHLVDAHHCTDSSKFVSVVMLSLSSMVRLELPHINVLSKIDLMQQYGKLAFNLDFYTDVLDLRYLLDRLDEPDDAEGEDQISLEPRHTTIPNSRLAERFRRMNEALVDVIEDFSLVSFLPLQIQDPATLQKVVAAIDKANGFVFTGVDFQTAVVKDYAFGDQSAPDIQEKYLDQ
ncbi:GPN-loop GTPase 2 [Phytophthora palmivora]|uniref:GPN-loop GTPase 2 n=1 Tax=Phytophthora palmivora TaxID=4796 RepID=A0A2P4XXL1_9STRA|nr:GPN-loop GTPase 2 [Phytophthora palmivora]